MGRWVLRYRGKTAPPAQDVLKLQFDSSVRVLDKTSRMLLVDVADEKPLQALVALMPDWSLGEDREYKLPDPHPALKIK